MFADDCFLLFRASQRECDALKEILSKYKATSGQAVHMEKSKNFFSGNVDCDVRDSLSQSFGVGEVLGAGKYLGLHSIVNRNRKVMFNYIKNRVSTRINSLGDPYKKRVERCLLSLFSKQYMLIA